MSAEDLEKYEADLELQLYREYRDVVGLFSYVVETERRFYLANGVQVTPRGADGEVWFAYPPDPLTIAHSVRELDASARLGAQVTFFRLGEDPGLARFIESMARRVGGRMVSPELDYLGAAVVGSYLGSRGPGGSYRHQFPDWTGGRGFWA